MTLVFRNDALGDAPGIHAFIVGVSEYPHLPGMAQPPNPQVGFGMKSLGSAAISAFSFYERLLQINAGADGEARLALPLKSCRLLLAPSQLERDSHPRLQLAFERDKIAVPNYVPFCAAAQEWREDAKTHKDNIALFYYSGHGVRTHAEDSVLALADFALHGLPVMHHCVKLSNLHLGMAPNQIAPDMARAQIYFVDACRNLPEGMLQFAPMAASSVFDIDLTAMIDDRSWPIFFSAPPNGIAEGRRGTTSYFCESLLNALKSASEEPEDDPDHEDGERWPITPDSLATGIERHLTRMLPPMQPGFVDVKGVRGKTNLVYLGAAPEVEVEILVSPTAIADSKTKLSVINGRSPDEPVVVCCDPLSAPTLKKKIPAGYYHVKVRSDKLLDDYQSNNKMINQKLVKPWAHKVQLKP